MSNVYIYETDDGFDIFLSSRELTDEERYCSHCDEYATLLKVTSDIREVISVLEDYGYTENTPRYQEVCLEFHTLVGGNNGRVNSKETE